MDVLVLVFFFSSFGSLKYFAVIKNLIIPLKSEPFSWWLPSTTRVTSPAVVSRCCLASAGLYWLLLVLKMAFTSDRQVVEHRVAGLCSWMLVLEITFTSETMRRRCKCCLFGFKQWLRILSQGECFCITLSWRMTPALLRRTLELPLPTLACWATGVKSSLLNTYSASNCSY